MRHRAKFLRMLLLVSALMFTAAACAAGVPSERADQQSCRPAGAHTLAADRAARVYSLSGAVYACLEATGRRQKLGGAGVCNLPAGRVGPVRLAGARVAYGLETCGVDTASSSVLVRGLAGGGQPTDLTAATLPLRAESFVSVAALVLRGDGAVGWIAGVDSVVSHGETYEVHRFEHGKSTLLDSGAAIRASSLRLVRARMTWRDGSATRSARLV